MPKLTLQQYINTLPLNPTPTGVAQLDSRVQALLAGGDTTYGKLQAVHQFLRGQCSHGPVSSSLADMSAFAGKKVFQRVTDLKYAYDANRLLTGRVGRAEHYAAAFTVAARALGLESYAVSGTLNGAFHMWSLVRLGDDLYVFDSYAEQEVFAKPEGEVSGYAAADRQGDMAAQQGFPSAGEFSVILAVSSDSGNTSRKYTWELEKAGTGDNDFLQNRLDLDLDGTVTFTLTVTGATGDVMLYDATGMSQKGNTLTGTLTPASGAYTLLVEEQTSGRSFQIRLDN